MNPGKLINFFRHNPALTIISVVTIMYWITLAFEIPIFEWLPRWMHFTYILNIPVSIVILLLVIAVAVIILITKVKGNHLIRLFILIALGIAIHFNISFLDGRGISVLEERIKYSGHGDFAKVAVQVDNITFFINNYEYLVEADQLGSFAKSKPPGTLLFYVLTNKTMEVVTGEKTDYNNTRAVSNLAGFASIVWPIMSYLVLLPLFYYCRILFGSDTALAACSLYIFVPSVNLITMHTDQVIFPILTMLPLLFSAISAKRNSLFAAFFTGVLVYVAVWFSFGLALIGPLILATCFLLIDKNNGYYRNLFKIVFAILIGFLVSDAAFRFLTNYDIVLRYKNAFVHHVAWIEWEETLEEYLTFGSMNLLQYALFLGLPIFGLVIMNFKKSVTNFIHKLKNMDTSSIFTVTVVGTLLLAAIFGKAKLEIARLWLFTISFVCMVAADYFVKRYKINNQAAFSLIIFLQLGTIYFHKVYQDFF